MLTRTVSRRRWRWRAALQGARGEWGKRAEADEKRAEADGGEGLGRQGGRLLRLAGAGRKPAAVAGPWEGTAGEAREAMGGELSLRPSATHRHRLLAGSERVKGDATTAVHVLSYG
jgi:hypothetical protein